ncbi:amidase [Sphingomonas lacunae]|uniref:Amidase n=1 Tax=Sphingomonas lacunae TaxID=2698828 RepID=A0A6M4AXI4_9SPHN|nr:amidase family protein [Sphingomonas lacunae]QJQ33705.1 amidase [Sphingomonas lacunae]
MTYPLQRSALETASAIAAGQTTAVAECEAAIARIETINPALNAVIVKDFERARADAVAADAALAAGDRRPLLGVPMTIKESFELAGTPSTWGFAEHRDNVAVQDGSTVRRLRAAGAIILGKTNVPVALADIQSVNPVYGRTVNPWDASRTCGGSSGGSAAAIASGMVPLEIGTDIGGSVRTPAHFCGVFGHKSSYGVIPLDGHRFPRTDGADRPLSVAGPLARTAADLSAALDVVSATPLAPSRITGLAGARLFIITHHPRAAVMQDIVAGIEAVAEKAQGEGASISRSSELMPDLAAIMASYMPMLNMIVTGGAPAPNGQLPTVQQWFALCDAQARIQRQFGRFFEQFDAILCPVHGTTAFPHDDNPDMRARLLMIDGKETRYADQFAWISMATFAGLPSTSVPIGRASDGLPFNMQVIAANRRDHDGIRLAGLLSGLVAD